MTTANQTEFAALLGVAKSYVTKLKQDGRLVMTSDGRVDVEASRKRIAETDGKQRDDVSARWADQREPAEEPAEEEQFDDGIPIKARSSAKKEHYLAMQAELDYRVRLGELVPKVDVTTAVADVATTFRQSLENLPHRLAGELVGKDLDTIRRTLKSEFTDLLSEMKGGFTDRIGKMAEEEQTQ